MAHEEYELTLDYDDDFLEDNDMCMKKNKTSTEDDESDDTIDSTSLTPFSSLKTDSSSSEESEFQSEDAEDFDMNITSSSDRSSGEDTSDDFDVFDKKAEDIKGSRITTITSHKTWLPLPRPPPLPIGPPPELPPLPLSTPPPSPQPSPSFAKKKDIRIVYNTSMYKRECHTIPSREILQKCICGNSENNNGRKRVEHQMNGRKYYPTMKERENCSRFPIRGGIYRCRGRGGIVRKSPYVRQQTFHNYPEIEWLGIVAGTRMCVYVTPNFSLIDSKGVEYVLDENRSQEYTHRRQHQETQRKFPYNQHERYNERNIPFGNNFDRRRRINEYNKESHCKCCRCAGDRCY